MTALRDGLIDVLSLLSNRIKEVNANPNSGKF